MNHKQLLLGLYFLVLFTVNARAQQKIFAFKDFKEPKGEKTKNALFKKVILNGTLVHRNAEVTGPTASSLDNKEEQFGPLMLQGDHGPVAYRNIVLKKR
jgi:hypothetical protein